MEQPAPKELKRIFTKVFQDSGYCQRMEIFNPGHGPHDDGSAIDIFLNANDSDQKKLADAIVRLLVSEKPRVKWGAVIWNRQTWDNRGGPVPYEQSQTMPHTDHIHIEWGPKGRVTMDFPGFEEKLSQVLQNHLADQ
ncbi:hypothetical protein [Spirosoma fluminis]